jgi:hypothetical protein
MPNKSSHKPSHPLYSLFVPEPRQTRKVTNRRKRKLRQQIKQTKPWLTTAGPKTYLGRKIASQNAIKHGIYARFGIG